MKKKVNKTSDQSELVNQLSAIFDLLTDEQKEMLAKKLKNKTATTTKPPRTPRTSKTSKTPKVSAAKKTTQPTVISDEKQAIQKIRKDTSQTYINQDTPCKREPIVLNKKQNRFFDMTDKRGNKLCEAHKKDTLIDKKLQKGFVSTPRIRNSNTTTVTCYICGRKENVSADIVLEEGRYKCNNCARI